MKNFLYPVFIILIVILIAGCPEPTPEPTLNPHCSIVVTFPDANLEAVIRDEIDKPVGEIYLCEVESIISLSGDASNISNLTGIENLTSLRNLSLSSNSLSDISVLAGLTSLRELNLQETSISDISALVDNSGIDSGDSVRLLYNSLNDASINTYIPILVARGVDVDY